MIRMVVVVMNNIRHVMDSGTPPTQCVHVYAQMQIIIFLISNELQALQ